MRGLCIKQFIDLNNRYSEIKMSLAYGQQQQSQAAQQPPPNQQQHRAMPPNRGPASGPPPPSSAHIQKILDENSSLIQTIQEYQHAGKGHECMNFHQNLHRNLVYLAQLAGLLYSLDLGGNK